MARHRDSHHHHARHPHPWHGRFGQPKLRPNRQGATAMNFVAIKMLVGDRLKYVALIAGVAFAALLITQQAAIFMGYTLRTGAWIRDNNYHDLWVMSEQVNFCDDLKPMTDT